MLDWSLLFQLAAEKLNWTPECFWKATPRELQMALGLVLGYAPCTRQSLETLLAMFPDGSANSTGNGVTS